MVLGPVDYSTNLIRASTPQTKEMQAQMNFLRLLTTSFAVGCWLITISLQMQMFIQ